MKKKQQLLARLAADIREAGVPRWKKPAVELVLGTDREIGRENHSTERRVGTTPGQVAELREFCRALGLDLSVLVLRGAGVRAGFSDGDYIHSGAEILTKEELEFHDGPPDVFHALKEPSSYEHLLPGPFCRLGALHSGNFQQDSGTARLLSKRDSDRLPGNNGPGRDRSAASAAIFDGSNIGTPYRNPIRGKMSEFAGRIAAQWIGEDLEHRGLEGRAVVVGGGRAGHAAAQALLHKPEVTEIHILDDESNPDRLDEIRSRFASPKIEVRGISGLDHARLRASLNGCVGTILAVFKRGEEAPKVVHVETLGTLPQPGSVIVDLSIDERGAILDPRIRPGWSNERIIRHMEQTLADHRYRTSDNIPRNRPHEASIAHGEVVLPYLATLLYLSAREGGVAGVIRYLQQVPIDYDSPDPEKTSTGRLPAALIQDLRNGMALYPNHAAGNELGSGEQPRIVVEDTVADRAAVFEFLNSRAIPFEFGLHPQVRDESVAAAGREDPKFQFRSFPRPVRECLEFAHDHRIESRIIFHRDQDGTRSVDAARALGVEVAEVLKCMILRDERDYWAAICEGTKRISLELVKDLIDAKELRLASPEEVYAVTGHSPGGVPVLQVFEMLEQKVLIDEEVIKRSFVVGSAGSEFVGIMIKPEVLETLGGRVAKLVAASSER